MKKVFALIVTAVLVIAIATPALAAGSGFDQFGYNDKAGIFVGPADGVDRSLDGAVWGDPSFANDNLVMKWNDAWTACNANGYDNPAFCAGAWTTNEWNGMMPDGSQSNWHYKMIWVGSAGEASPYWREGGYLIWGNYEVIQDFGFDPTGHFRFAQARPAGLGN